MRKCRRSVPLPCMFKQAAVPHQRTGGSKSQSVHVPDVWTQPLDESICLNCAVWVNPGTGQQGQAEELGVCSTQNRMRIY